MAKYQRSISAMLWSKNKLVLSVLVGAGIGGEGSRADLWICVVADVVRIYGRWCRVAMWRTSAIQLLMVINSSYRERKRDP